MLAGRVHLHLVTFVLVQFFANRCLKGESALSHGASAGASGGQCHGKAGARSGHLLPSATVATYFQKQKQAKNKNNEKRRNASLSGIETLRWLRSHHAVCGQVRDVCSARTKTPDATSGTGTGSERRVLGAAWPAAGDTRSSPFTTVVLVTRTHGRPGSRVPVSPGRRDAHVHARGAPQTHAPHGQGELVGSASKLTGWTCLGLFPKTTSPENQKGPQGLTDGLQTPVRVPSHRV